MKNLKYTLAIFALVISNYAFGQITTGVKTGISVSTAEAELYLDAINDAPKSYTSFLVGGFVDIELHKNFSLLSELQYVRRGFTINEGTSFDLFGLDIPVGGKATTNISYMEAPILAKGKVGNGVTNFYGIVGPAIGYATSATIQPKVTLLLDFNLPEMNVNLDNDIYNRTEISGIIGAGIEHNLPNGKLFADVRYQRSFTNIINNPIVDISVRNSGIQLAIGYGYRF